MCRTLLILALSPLLLAGAAAPSTAPTTSPAAAIPPVIPIAGKLGKPIALFNGTDLAGWSWHSSTADSKISDAFTVKDAVLKLAAKPAGFIDTDKPYKNFVLTVEQRHLTKANGGLFICINGEEKQWPDAIQIQGNFGKVGDLINQNSAMKKMTTDPARTAKSGTNVEITRLHPDAEKAVGEWNTVVITMENGNLNVTLNGVMENTAKDISPDAGKVGIQAEGAEMELRKIELVPIE